MVPQERLVVQTRADLPILGCYTIAQEVAEGTGLLRTLYVLKKPEEGLVTVVSGTTAYLDDMLDVLMGSDK